jgi:hypothetical protein
MCQEGVAALLVIQGYCINLSRLDQELHVNSRELIAYVQVPFV